ncbi:MAG: BadF/BadG/BcrA/BcrD ATPase family protein [Bacteroidales bacterium]|nr:BadF/BadG/BcrA/BcrD ATPase family protein [Bacteroidales bacterium]MDD4770708.1 BadF/BadG/BcrA/BcrD ATPase family protein [Bacteroidales bacterium]
MKANRYYRIGLDIGSTTLKLVVLDEGDHIVYKNYVRHNADVTKVLLAELDALTFLDADVRINITGSAGMGVAERLNASFTQEVIAAIEVIKRFYSGTHTMIDLGGEDAKIVFFEEGRLPDIRMNGSCAGGTGAFIDQMADLLHVSLSEMAVLAEASNKTHHVASRCGVFAKTDVQNLIARNVPKADIAMSVFQTVAMQAITSLVHGNNIRANVLCIGGPLTFIPALRQQFRQLLDLEEDELVLPENSAFFPALGCALLI